MTWWTSRLQTWGRHGNVALGIHRWVGTQWGRCLPYWPDEAGQPLPAPAAQREVSTLHLHCLLQLNFNGCEWQHFIERHVWFNSLKILLFLLWDRCEKGVMSSVNVRNCIRFYQTAEELNATTLMNYCGEIIASHWVRTFRQCWWLIRQFRGCWGVCMCNNTCGDFCTQSAAVKCLAYLLLLSATHFAVFISPEAS